jgi:hypothetical protein
MYTCISLATVFCVLLDLVTSPTSFVGIELLQAYNRVTSSHSGRDAMLPLDLAQYDSKHAPHIMIFGTLSRLHPIARVSLDRANVTSHEPKRSTLSGVTHSQNLEFRLL